jgi:serine/threonine protein kinase
MGDAWLAKDEDLGAQVVIKMVSSDASPEQISLLQHECRSARRLSHPNIVRVFDFHQDPVASFITMEYVEGGDLSQFRGQPPSRILEVVLPLVEALEYAHGEGVVHRDLKCSNVLVDTAGRPRLSDFGIAGVLDPTPEDLLLAGGGSRDHASPQQKAGESVSSADDVFGLGALLRDLLGSSPSLPRSLARLVQSMVAPEAEDRPADMTAVRTELETLTDLDTAASTAPPRLVMKEVRLSPPPKVPSVRSSEPIAAAPVRAQDSVGRDRHPYWWLTVTVFLVLAVAAFGVIVWLPGWVEKRASKTVESPMAEAQDVAVAAEAPPAPMEVSETRTPAEPEILMEESTSDEAETPPTSPAREAPAAAAEEPKVKKRQPPSTKPAPKVDRQAKEFASAMTAGLRASEAGDLEGAKGAFERALLVRPESAEAADGLARVEQGLRLAAIRSHQARAEDAERQERWAEATREYTAALALDPSLRFANVGQDRTQARATLDDQLEYHIANPQRLSEDAVLTKAGEVLADARAIEPPTPRLRQQMERLQAVIKKATTPIEVVLVSDNLTNVVVYRVGRLGTFERRALDLRPGTYTVVGTREGYRDVRYRLVVAAEGPSPTLIVHCAEEI